MGVSMGIISAMVQKNEAQNTMNILRIRMLGGL